MTYKKTLLIPYITAGFPSKKLFVPILKELSQNGADFIEVGVPHSDPLADGPTIQNASKIALNNGVNLKWILETCHTIQTSKKQIKPFKPLILFSYFNPLLQYGFEKLLKDLPKPLFHGLIIPDLPPEEAQKYLPLFKKHNLNLILLASITSSKKRLEKIASLSTSFIYLVSVVGVTGIRSHLSKELKSKIKELKAITNKPIIVGFGISSAKQASKIISHGASGIVIGSIIIKSLEKKKTLSSFKRFINKFRASLNLN